MYETEKLIGALTGSLLLEISVRRWPITFQEGYHYFLSWLEKHAADKADVFLGKVTHDFRDNWSIEREQLWRACQWGFELLNRAYAKGEAPDYAKIDTAIRRELGIKYMPQILSFTEMTLFIPPEQFQFEAYLKKECIEFHGLPTFIAAVEYFNKAFEDWNPRYLKVSQALLLQEFIGDEVLTPEESKRLGLALAAFTDNLSVWPKHYAASLDIVGDIRTVLGLHEPQGLEVVSG